MFDSFHTILNAIWCQDFSILRDPSALIMIYVCVAVLIFLDSAFIPAAPLPCDSMIILSGTLSGLGIIDYRIMLVLLIVSSSIGSLVAFAQGSLLHKLPKVNTWMSLVNRKKMLAVDSLLIKNGAIALLIARCIPVVRSLLPLVMATRGYSLMNFNRIAWTTACIWALSLSGFGYILTLLPKEISHMLTTVVMIGPLITLGVGILAIVFGWLRGNFRAGK